ncbi:carboxypeptidase regulatory-like domain-containing protein [Acidobacteriota bacterium]
MKLTLFKASLFFIIFILFTGFSSAQEQYGHIRGIIVDTNKEPVPGVMITLECPRFGIRSRTSSSGGMFRFINLAPGTYSLKCNLFGFKSYLEEDIIIRVGNNFDFRIILEPAVLEEEVTVVAKSPIVDTKKTGISVNISEMMLQEIPSVRDPWDILKQAPGIYISGENVGGMGSGTMSTWTSKGAGTKYFGNFNLDGVNVTSKTPSGNSSRYYDFDSFDEIMIVTTGQDPSIKTGGVSVNVVTRRGGNKPGFLGRFFFTNDKFQSDNRTQELIDLEYGGDQIRQLTDYGFQAGGPIVKDKFWFWLGYGVQDIRLLSVDGYPIDTKIESLNAKLNFHLSQKDRAELAFIYNDHNIFNSRVGPFRPPEATYNEVGNGNPLVKFEYERIFSDVFLMSAKLAYSWGWNGWEPNGGLNAQAGFDLFTGMTFGNAQYLRAHSPSYSAQADGNYFLEDFLGGDHEFKFGAEYRLIQYYGDHKWPGGVQRRYYNGEPFQGRVFRCLYDRAGDRFSFYFNEAYSRGRLTFNVGVRVDRENFWNDEIEVPANPIAPAIMPGFKLPRIDPGIILWTFSPRLGLTIDLTGDGKTILRAYAARYGWWPDDLASILSVSEENYAIYDWDDMNGDDLVSTDELIGYPYDGLLSYGGYNPFDPTNPVSPYEISKDLNTGSIDEILLGAEREIFKDFALSANLTIRRFRGWTWWVNFDRETGRKDNREDWGDPIRGSITVSGQTYDYEYWAPSTHRFDLPNQILENRRGWSAHYTGLEVIATKRMSNRWMLNASFTIQRNIDRYREGSYTDPTNIDKLDGGSNFNEPRWMAKLNFLYQLPWGINFSGFAYARQGTISVPWIRVFAPERRAKGWGSFAQILVEEYGKTRMPDFYKVDISLSKNFNLGRYGRLTIQADAFNVFNFHHTLGRMSALHSPRYGEIGGILNPRVIRFGLRYRF